MNSQTPRFRLFTTQNSPFSRKAVLVLKSLGVAFTEIVEDPDAPSEAFAALGPARRFPILVDDITGAVAPDSTLILEYLNDLFGGVWGNDADAAAKLRARVAEDEADLLVEETNKMVTDTLLINTPYANNPRVLRAISNREARVARLLTEFQGMIVDSRTADGGGKGFLDSSKPTAVEFAVVSTLGHLSYRTNDSWRQTYLTLARFNDEMQAHPDVRATNPKV